MRNRRSYLGIAVWLSIMTVLAMAWTLRSRHRHEAQLLHLAHHDPLTALANRSQLNDAVQRSLATHQSFALHLIDLDGFKQVNDTYGHAAGDTLLKLVAQRLCAVLRHCDFAARLGGDEFAVVQAGVPKERMPGRWPTGSAKPLPNHTKSKANALPLARASALPSAIKMRKQPLNF